LVPQAGFFWVDGKGGKREKVATNKKILDLLGTYKRKPHEYIFQSKTGGKIKQTSDTLRRTVEELGLSPRTVIKKGRKEIRVKMTPDERKEYQRKKIWFHTFRHTYASWLAQSGTVTLLELRDLLRHESTQMTERYAHMIPDKLVEQSSKINKILETT
jgi:integrase